MWCISSTSRSCRRSRIDFVWEWQAVPPPLVYSVYYTRINPRKWKILEKNEAKIQKNVKEKIRNNFVWQAAPPPLVVVNTSSTHLSTNITKKSQKTKKKKIWWEKSNKRINFVREWQDVPPPLVYTYQPMVPPQKINKFSKQKKEDKSKQT